MLRDWKAGLEMDVPLIPLEKAVCCAVLPLYAYQAPEATRVEIKAREKLRRCIDDCNDAGMNVECFPAEDDGRMLNAWLLENETARGLLPATFHTGARRAVRKAWIAARLIEMIRAR